MRYSGPLYAQLAMPLPACVARFLDGPGPIVYVAITSSPPDLVRTVIGALAAVDARVLVAATLHDLRDLAGAGDDRRRTAQPPDHASGGPGDHRSVQTAMAGGTPLIGIPLQPEQDLNVFLLERRGAARRITPRARARGR
jgi:UDP:flavonoid glycosyltransferase YjiC (YdhE family)